MTGLKTRCTAYMHSTLKQGIIKRGEERVVYKCIISMQSAGNLQTRHVKGSSSRRAQSVSALSWRVYIERGCAPCIFQATELSHRLISSFFFSFYSIFFFRREKERESLSLSYIPFDIVYIGIHLPWRSVIDTFLSI